MDCKFKNNCKLKDSEYCSEFCERYVKLNYLFSSSLIPDTALEPTALFVDSDGSDRDSFVYLKDIQSNIKQEILSGVNLYLYSKTPGNGKTSWSLRLLKAYIYNIWAESNIETKALFINVPRYLLELKANIDEKTDYIQHIKKNVMNCDLVIWDDIATKSATEFEHEHLLSMIDYRLYNSKANIFTSNVDPNELGDLLGSRLASRIINESRVIPFVGKDKRGLTWKLKS